MQTFKISARNKANTETIVFSLDAASRSQAACFVRHALSDYRIKSMKEIGWQLDTHYDFVQVSHFTHVAQMRALRKRRMASA